jgi:hypothetical protein
MNPIYEYIVFAENGLGLQILAVPEDKLKKPNAGKTLSGPHRHRVETNFLARSL